MGDRLSERCRDAAVECAVLMIWLCVRDPLGKRLALLGRELTRSQLRMDASLMQAR